MGLEFDKAEALEVSCLAHHPNSSTSHTVPARDVAGTERNDCDRLGSC